MVGERPAYLDDACDGDAALRAEVEGQLHADGMDATAIAECAAALSEDAGTLDIKQLMGVRKESSADRSK